MLTFLREGLGRGQDYLGKPCFSSWVGFFFSKGEAQTCVSSGGKPLFFIMGGRFLFKRGGTNMCFIGGQTVVFHHGVKTFSFQKCGATIFLPWGANRRFFIMGGKRFFRNWWQQDFYHGGQHVVFIMGCEFQWFDSSENFTNHMPTDYRMALGADELVV